MQYGFLLDSCDVILLCIVSQISNKNYYVIFLRQVSELLFLVAYHCNYVCISMQRYWKTVSSVVTKLSE